MIKANYKKLISTAAALTLMSSPLLTEHGVNHVELDTVGWELSYTGSTYDADSDTSSNGDETGSSAHSAKQFRPDARGHPHDGAGI